MAPYPVPSSAEVTLRMKANRSRDTAPELRLRSALHRAGLRFRVNYRVRVSSQRAISVDIVFPRLKIAIFCRWMLLASVR